MRGQVVNSSSDTQGHIPSNNNNLRLGPECERPEKSTQRMFLAQRSFAMLKHLYWRWQGGGLGAELRERLRARKIDLRRTLIGGDGIYRGLSWEEITEDMPSVISTRLEDSPHVKLLEQYRTMGETLFVGNNFEQTEYFRLGRQWIRLTGDYFGQRTNEGLRVLARSFVTLYERIKNGDWTPVDFPSRTHHSGRGSLPTIRPTLTPTIFKIVEGHHRLAIAWVLGGRKARITLLPPMPTELQHLAVAVSQNWGYRRLCQPIDRLDFDRSWEPLQPCEDYLAMMLNLFTRRGVSLKGLSVINLGCSYGWYVAKLSALGCQAIGVEPDAAALKIGRLAYGLRAEQLAQNDLPTFVGNCNRNFDVVLLSGGLYDLARNANSRSLGEFLKRVDSITGRYLFLDMGLTREVWWPAAFPEWNQEAIEEFVKRHMSFSHVLRFPADPKDTGNCRAHRGGTLLACIRSC